MPRGTARYIGAEVEVEFSAKGVLSDYGVPRSPTWIEWEDVEIEGLTVLDHKVDLKILPDALIEAIRELADDLTFETEEPEYE